LCEHLLPVVLRLPQQVDTQSSLFVTSFLFLKSLRRATGTGVTVRVTPSDTDETEGFSGLGSPAASVVVSINDRRGTT